MTCKDCIHRELCADYVSSLAKVQNADVKYISQWLDEIEGKKNQTDNECEHFADCSRFVELPCSVGETVYRICPVENGKGCGNCPWEYCECHDIGFQNDRKNSIREGKANNFAWILKRIPYFGEIYFTTREAAAQALKECKKDE